MYKLLDSAENRVQYSKFLEQYSSIDAKDNKTNDELHWLELRKYQLEVTWINADNTLIDEVKLPLDDNKVVKGNKKKELKSKK